MNKYCVDTNIIIYTMNGLRPAVQFMKKAENYNIIFPVIVEAELFSSWKLTNEDMQDLRSVLDLGEIIDVTSEIGLKAAELRRYSKINYKRNLKIADALVVATALKQSATLITRNERDFSHLLNYGLHLFNPFASDTKSK